MRKLTATNKKTFVIFAFIVVIIIGLFIYGLILALEKEEPKYNTSNTNIFFDNEYNYIKLENDGEIKKSWNGNFYLHDIASKDKYNLGKEAITFDTSKNRIDLFGTIYEVLNKGEVRKGTGNTQIGNLFQDRIFKLADRKYLICGKKIQNQTGSLQTKYFLLVVIDKSGNTLILNNEISAKTIKPMIINTDSFKLDVANEKLIWGERYIDLKKIIGSSNKYVEEIKEENIEEKEPDKEENTEQNNTDNNQNNNQNNNTTNNTTNNNTNNSTNTNNNVNINNKPIDENKAPLSKSVNLREVKTSSSYIDINYTILDPENKFQTVYALVESLSGEKLVALDKTKNTYRVNGLTPDTEYKVTLGYKEVTVDNTVEDKIEDILKVRTEKASVELVITKVTASKIYFNIKIDKNYAFDSGKLVLYVDGIDIKKIELDTVKALEPGGFSSSFDYEYGFDIAIRLQEVIFNKNPINYSIEAKFRNY